MKCDLANKHCAPCEGGVPALSPEQVEEHLATLEQWQTNETRTEISKAFTFKNYYHVMAFVNAVAFIAHQEKHHPDLTVHYNRVVVRYSTHAIGGLSDNDLICAAKVDQLIR